MRPCAARTVHGAGQGDGHGNHKLTKAGAGRLSNFLNSLHSVIRTAIQPTQNCNSAHDLNIFSITRNRSFVSRYILTRDNWLSTLRSSALCHGLRTSEFPVPALDS